MRGDVLAIVRGRERADPGVEHLDHVRAGARLGGDVGGERGGELLEQRVPDVGLAEHEALRVLELPARLPLDEVARHGERAAAEADDGLVGPELRTHDPHRLEHRAEGLLGIGDAQLLHVGERAHRLVDDRADALHELGRRRPSRAPAS